jgi:hypothetical protein
MNVHHLADSSHAEAEPIMAKNNAINAWKARNDMDREMSMSQGCDGFICMMVFPSMS